MQPTNEVNRNYLELLSSQKGKGADALVRLIDTVLNVLGHVALRFIAMTK